MIKNLGVMQGRLLPKYQGRYQAHPVGYWQDEFEIAKKLGLELIEFIFSYDLAMENPLMDDSGLEEIQRISGHTGVKVKTICADYFKEAPLHNPVSAHQSFKMLQTLIYNAAKCGINVIVIPCVDQASLQNEQDFNGFIHNILPIREIAEKSEVSLALETDLSPFRFGELLEKLNYQIFTVNYDTGDSACWGYDPEEELSAYGNRIADIHLKDRPKGEASVELGKGNTDFDRFFTALSKINYSGPVIMQAYRDDEGLQIFRKQLEWIRSKLNDWAGNSW